MPTNKYFKCPFCDKRLDRKSLVNHISSKHIDELPEEFTPLRATFHAANRKSLDYRPPCRICKNPTEWDEKKGRYNQLCGKQSCHDAYVLKMKRDMGDRIGINRQTATAEGLEKMLAGRRISGKYKFHDGKEFTYTGSYELKALEFMDKVLHCKSEDIMMPGPALKYELDGKQHIYITDMYYIPYDLIIEIKDGGDKPNTNPAFAETRRKVIAKEKFIIEKTDYNYIRLTNNDFSQLLNVFADLKLAFNDDRLNNTTTRIIHANEAVNMSRISFSSSFADVKEIVDSLPKKELTRICTGNFKNSPYVVARKVCLVNNEPACFIDAYSIPSEMNNDEAVIVCACKKKFRKNGLTKLCFDNEFIKELKNSAIKTVYWETTKDNKPSSKLAKSLGFKKSKDVNIDDDNYVFVVKSIKESDSFIIEHMVGAIQAAMPPAVRKNDVVVVNYMQNSVFSKPKIAVANNIKFDRIFKQDEFTGIVEEVDKSFLENCTYEVYVVHDVKNIVSDAIEEALGSIQSPNFFYDSVFGHCEYTPGQIEYESNAEKITDYYYNLAMLAEETTDYILNEGVATPAKVDKIKELNKTLNEYDYGMVINGRPVHDITAVKPEEYITISASEFEHHKLGTCWDFVNYEADVLRKMGISYKCYFAIMGEEGRKVTPTHTFLTFKSKDGLVYWFESSWGGNKGLRSYSNEEELLADFFDRFTKKRSKWREVDLYEYRPSSKYVNITSADFINKITTENRMIKQKFNKGGNP